MRYPDYLVHVNQNHNPKNGQFAPGDGDGDGVSNDHANQRKKTTSKKNTATKKKSTAKKKYNEVDAWESISKGITNAANTYSYALEKDPSRKLEKGVNLFLDNSKLINNGSRKAMSRSEMVYSALDDVAYAGKIWLSGRQTSGNQSVSSSWSTGTDLLAYTIGR